MKCKRQKKERAQMTAVNELLEGLEININDLDLISRLEQHAGFVLNRLECDGNILAGAVDLDHLHRGIATLATSFAYLREAMRQNGAKSFARADVMRNMDKFTAKDWE